MRRSIRPANRTTTHTCISTGTQPRMHASTRRHRQTRTLTHAGWCQLQRCRLGKQSKWTSKMSRKGCRDEAMQKGRKDWGRRSYPWLTLRKCGIHKWWTLTHRRSAQAASPSMLFSCPNIFLPPSWRQFKDHRPHYWIISVVCNHLITVLQFFSPKAP